MTHQSQRSWKALPGLSDWLYPDGEFRKQAVRLHGLSVILINVPRRVSSPIPVSVNTHCYLSVEVIFDEVLFQSLFISLTNIYQVPECARHCSSSRRKTIINSLLCFHRIFTVYKICHLIFAIAWKMGSKKLYSYTVLQIRAGISQSLRSPSSPEPSL